jgi:hypothetical protein
VPRKYPENQEMQVSHETIYLSLFIQGRVPYATNWRRVCVLDGPIDDRRQKCDPIGKD